MWKLVSSDGHEHYLFPSSICRVGRQGCEILLSDPTVSRHHADLSVSIANHADEPAVTLKDVSKFVQTTVNGVLLSESARELVIACGTTIQFGAALRTFTLKRESLIFSSATPEILHRFRPAADICGIVLDGVWNPDMSALLCDPATVIEHPNLLIARCIMHDIPLISTKYVEALASCRSGCETIPSLSLFRLPIPSPDVCRESLFRGMSFIIFGDEDITSTYSVLIKAGGGSVVSRDEIDGDMVAFVVADDRLCDSDCSPLQSARVISFNDVCIAISTGTSGSIQQLPVTNFKRHEVPSVNNTQSGWIVSGSKTNSGKRTDGSHISQFEPPVSAYAIQSGETKRFKKSYPTYGDSELIELHAWSGSTSATNTGGKLAKPDKLDALDQWIDGALSQ